MAIQGTLATMSVADLLQFLAVGKKTGTLKFSHAKVVKGIYFEDGIIVGSSTNDPKEYLGQVLIHYGKINEAQLQAAMEVQRSRGRGRLGNILVEQKIVTEEEVAELLKVRTLDIIYDLFIWKEAHFEFVVEETLPEDFTRIDVEPTMVIMEGIYRADEITRFHTLIPSDRAVMDLGSGWTSSLTVSKEVRQLLFFVGKRMSVAEICYNMHAAPFEIYAKLFDLVSRGLAVVTGELPETPDPLSAEADLPESTPELLTLAQDELQNDNADRSLTIIHKVLSHEPKNPTAQNLLVKAEEKFIKQVYSEMSPDGVPKIVINPDALSEKNIGPQEGFMLSRINGEWDIQSILSICPFREADSLRLIKTLLDNGIIGF